MGPNQQATLSFDGWKRFRELWQETVRPEAYEMVAGEGESALGAQAACRRQRTRAPPVHGARYLGIDSV
jgi:hypothetical protein